MIAFQVDLKACLGLVSPNQYCPIDIWENWGYFSGNFTSWATPISWVIPIIVVHILIIMIIVLTKFLVITRNNKYCLKHQKSNFDMIKPCYIYNTVPVSTPIKFWNMCSYHYYKGSTFWHLTGKWLQFWSSHMLYSMFTCN